MVIQLIRDENHIPVAGGVSSASSTTVLPFTIDSVTGRLLTDNSGGSGTVTSVSVVTANGFAGSVANATTTPAITLTTTVNSPVLAGNGTAIAAATTTGSGSTVVLNNSPTFVDDITVGTASTATGSILFKGTTSGTVTLSVADAAGTWTMKLPTTAGTNGYFLKTDGSGNTSWDTGPAASLTVGTTAIASGTDTRILYDNAGTLGEYTITGTGTVVAMQTNPTFSGITMTDATNIVLDSVTGTKIGTAASQKLSFYNVTPIIQPTGDVATALSLLGLIDTPTVNSDTVTVANEATDTTCFPVFVTAATGDLELKSNTNLTFNSNTGSLGATLLTATTSVTSASILASSNDSGALGAAATAFSDLFLASGALIGFANGNAVITHSSGVLTVSTGDFRVTTAGTNTASVVTVGGTQTLTSKTLTSPAITTGTYTGTQLLAEGASVGLDPSLSADGTYTGITVTGTAGAALAFGDCIYLAAADSRWELADASAVSTGAQILIGMCVQAAASDGDPTTILLCGNIRADTTFPSFTISAPVFLSETAGDVTNTAPTTTDSVTIALGRAITADSMFFVSPMDWATHV